MYTCPECNKQFDKLNSLSAHWRLVHKKTSEDLAIIIHGAGSQPTCKCGCGEPTRFLSITRGFTEWKRGHKMRVKNNWGHNKKALRKSHETTRQRYESGELEVWNKGLTTETDARVATYGRSQSINSWSISKREEYANRMRENRLSGIVPSLTGSAHSQWNGGTSQLGSLCHASPRLYTEWKYPKLLAAQFKCERCGSSDNLHVHHSATRMADIVNEYRWALFPAIKGELEWEQKQLVAEAVVAYHIEEDVPGEVICQTCHGKEHPSLNFTAE